MSKNICFEKFFSSDFLKVKWLGPYGKCFLMINWTWLGWSLEQTAISWISHQGNW